MNGSCERLPGWRWIPLSENADAEVVIAPDRFRWVGLLEGSALEASVDFEVRDGRLVCTGLALSGVIDGSAVRGVSLDDIGRESLAGLAMLRRRPATPAEAGYAEPTPGSAEEHDWFFGPDVVEEPSRRDARHAATKGVKGGRGRPRVPEVELRQVAEVYRAATGQPVKAVAAKLALTDRQAARRVAQARERGLLPTTSRGKVTR